MLVMVNDEAPKVLGRKAAAEAPHRPDVVLLARCVAIDDDPRYWHLSVQLPNGRHQLRKIRVLDILGVPAPYLLQEETDDGGRGRA